MEQDKTVKNQIGKIENRDIVQEMKESYLDYAMSVIVARALPDVRDGLKPVQRRILFAMYDMGLRHNAKYRKSATVVGEVIGKYHPHGDIPVYEALVRMVQDFSLRYPLIEGQGNFGSIDNDPPAAYRYTEARLSRFGEEMLKDIEKNTVDFVDNYDGTRKEPVVLPSPLPQLLLNGTLGIAVGMATSVPPHNLKELCQALIYLIDKPEASIEEILQFIKGPDFPTGGVIYGARNLKEIYSQGKGSIILRGKVEVEEEEKTNRQRLIISEIPFQVAKATLLEQFAKLVEQKQITDIKNIRDESDREGLRIVIELQKGAIAQRVLQQLYKFSDLEKNFNLNLLALIDGLQPKVLSLLEALQFFLDHRVKVITRRTQFDLKRAQERCHILEGLEKCLARIDEVIKVIKNSKDKEEARLQLIKKFKLSDFQARAILETKLHQLAKLERKKIEEELEQKRKEIRYLEGLLKSPLKIKGVIKEELNEIIKIYGDERRTKIVLGEGKKLTESDLIPSENVVITLTKNGFIKRVKPDFYKIQKRGGKGILGAKVGDQDYINRFLLANTRDSLLFFTNTGRLFSLPVFELPEGNRVWRGRHLANFLEVLKEEQILDIIAHSFKEKNEGYLFLATERGLVKKTAIKEFENIRRSGIICLKLKKGDSLVKVVKTSGEDFILLSTQKGKAILFKEKEIRPMGRAAAGVRAIRLAQDDKVVGLDLVIGKTAKTNNLKQAVLFLSEKGYGKRTLISQYRFQKRGGAGVKTTKISSKTGNLVFVKVLEGFESDLIIISKKGQVIRTEINSVPILSRLTQGVRLIKLNPGDEVAGAVCV